MKPIEITSDNFEQEVLQSSLPVLLDFWAVWCAPCKMIEPIVNELATEYDGQAKIGKINVDNNPNIAEKYGIRGIPTILLFNNGQVIDMIVGVVSKQKLTEKILSLLP